jgi:glycine/D-amino acid oxidase-like deaminating enzyme
MQTFDAIVLGMGAMGAAATYQLAKRGVRVLGIDHTIRRTNKVRLTAKRASHA